MSDNILRAKYWLSERRVRQALSIRRVICGCAVIVGVYVAAQLAGARHAGWVAVSLGLLLAVPAARSLCGPEPLLPRSAPARSAAPVRLGLLVPVAAVLFAVVLTPVLVTRMPPFDDYTNHLARIWVMVTNGSDPLLDRFYGIRWTVVPNLAIDLIAPLLVKATGIYLGGKLFIVLYTLLLLTGPHAIQAALYRRLSLGPLVASLFIYNSINKFGVVNYEFGVGLALWLIAGWIALRRSAAWLRVSVSIVCVIVLFFCHLMALGLYGLAIGSFELWSWWVEPKAIRARLWDGALLALPFAVAIPLLMLGPRDNAFAIPAEWGGLHARMDGIRYVFQAYYPRLDLIAMVGMAIGLAWALYRRVLRLHPFVWVFLAVAIAVYLVMPNRAMGSWGAAVRLPIALLFVVIGALQWNLASARARAAFVLIVAALAIFRTATVEAAFRHYDRIRVELDASLQQVPPGSRILIADEYRNSVELLIAIRQLPCLAVIERSSLVSLVYSHPLQQILVVKPPYRQIAGGYSDQPVPLADLLHPPPASSPAEAPFYAPSGRIYWRDWPHTYDFVYIMDRSDPASPAPGRLQLLDRGERFELFRVVRG